MMFLLAAALAAPPTDASYNGEWKEGYAAGLAAGDELDALRVGGVGLGAGAVLAGTGIASCGVLGTPCLAAAVFVPGVTAFRTPPIPGPGPWESESADYQGGYVEGYRQAARQGRMRSAAIGGALGAVLGTGVGIGVIVVADSAING